MRIPGFTADTSLPRTFNVYQGVSARGTSPSGMIRPAILVNVPRVHCWCAEEGMIEVGVGPFKWAVEGCVRLDCVMVPFFVDV